MRNKYLNRRNYIIAGGVVLVLLLAWLLWPKQDGAGENIVVKRGTISQQVDVTGQTRPSQNAEMSFDRSGRISSAPVKVGEHVAAGTVIAALDSRDLMAQLAQGEAELDALLKGSRPEQVAVAEAGVQSALSSFFQALQTSYNQADDAIRNRTDQLFDNPSTAAMFFKLDGAIYEVRRDITERRNKLETDLAEWQVLSNSLTLNYDVPTVYGKISTYLASARTYLDKVSAVINAYQPSPTYPAATLSGYRADLAAARSEINTALSAVNSAAAAYKSATRELALTKAPPTTEQIAAKEAQLDGIRAQVAKNMIVAPFSGVVTKQDAKPGETATPGAKMVTIMSDGNFEIEANVPEVDIGKLALGNQVSFTLDAFPGENWTGRVSYIEPAETVVDGVIDYRIKVGLESADSRLKSGLTANLTIKTLEKKDVLILPQYAIIENDQGSFVDRLDGSKTVRVPVKTGIRSQTGEVEILSGLKEGDTVLNVGLKKK